MNKLRKFALALLYYCKRKGNCDIDFTNDGPLKNLLEVASVHPLFKDIFEIEIAGSLTCSYLNHFMAQTKEKFTNQDADELINKLYEGLKGNIAQYWIISPLKGAYLTRTIRYKDFVFITGDKKEKIDVLRRLGNTSMKKAEYRVDHTLTKSENFFDHPLLAIRVKHQDNFVRIIANNFSFYANSILQAIYWGRVHPEYEMPLISATMRGNKANHLLIYGKEDWRIKHLYCNFDTTCNLNLEFLNEKLYIRLFSKIFSELMYDKSDNERKVIRKFLHGFKLLKCAIDLESNKNLHPGIGIPLLLMTTASENILLKREDAKRNRLSVLYSRLVSFDHLSNTDITKTLNNVYSWRSEFVHGGTEIYIDYNEDFSDGKMTQTYELFKKILSSLLCKTVYYMSLVERKSKKTDISIEEIWYRYLNNHWERGKGILKKKASCKIDC